MADAGKAGESEGAGGRAKRCPICGKDAVEAYSPFCSKRCADIDLHRWLSGRYSIPAVENEDTTEEKGPDDADQR